MDEAAVADIFAAFRPIRIRRMFGGIGLYADGLMFALVADGQIYLKADADFARDLGVAGSRPFRYEAAGKLKTMNYWSLPDAAIDDADTAAALAERASAIARAAAALKPPKRAKPRTK